MRKPFAYACGHCDHPLSQHFLDKNAESASGPYACSRCDCRRSQSDEQYPITRTQFDAMDAEEPPATCHCGEPLAFGFDGDPNHHRGMCAHCDAVRCDAYPGACHR